jgi:hypothetical protein
MCDPRNSPAESEPGVPVRREVEEREIDKHSRGETERRFELQEPQFEWREVRRNRQKSSIPLFAGRNRVFQNFLFAKKEY